MANVKAEPAPRIGASAVGALVVIIGVELGVPSGIAWGAEVAPGAAVQQSGDRPSLAPTAPSAPGVNAISNEPPLSRGARVPGWRTALGVGVTVVGLAAVASGAYFLWQNGQRYDCLPPDSNGVRCLHTRNYALAAWLLVAGGAAATLGGVTLAVVPVAGESGGHAPAGLAVSAVF